ncbi:MAG TPA: DUF5329 family protein [Opitutaceae bacterium]|nr:DUF5329 family protein [Opitutaceae bacterium]
MKALIWLGLLLFASPVFSAEANQEIESLLSFLKAQSGVVFVRNGSEHTSTQAESHLRMKWDRQRKKIRSADDFIAACASKSSISGTRYFIRYANGQTRFADEVLRDELRRLREAEKRSS